MNADHLADLRRQSAAFRRTPTAHNRRSLKGPTADVLRARMRRRKQRQRLRAWISGWLAAVRVMLVLNGVADETL